jgi:signal peptidase II
LTEESSPAVTDIAEEPSSDGSDAAAQAVAAAEPSRRGPAWAIFIGLAVVVFVVDQLAKSWIVAHVAPGQVVEVLGDYVRLVFTQNNGALFGLFSSSAILFAVGSLVVLVLIVWYHARTPRNVFLSIALGLLLGGATSNLVDRLRIGYVVDFIDIGIGNLRFFTFNIGDSAISLAILLLLLLAFRSEARPVRRGG